jgi:hypothetical protein
MRLLRAILAGVLGACAALAVACGDTNGLLGSNDASGLSSQLDRVSAAVDAGNCTRATNAAANLQEAVVNLPGTVDRRLVTSLQGGASTIAAQAAKACKQARTDTTDTDTTTTETTTTETQPTQTVTTPTQTVTTPTQTVTTPTTPTTTPTTPTTPTTTPTAPTGGGGTGGGTGTGGTTSGGAAPGQ